MKTTVEPIVSLGHMAPEGEVLGAIRLEYNLNHVNSRFNTSKLRGHWHMAVISFVAFVLTMGLNQNHCSPFRSRLQTHDTSQQNIKIYPPTSP
ncbi:hypothetical protein O9992_16865 [Vibrio lentus]|nr:hypothetical protein [Vibrio lentus]